MPGVKVNGLSARGGDLRPGGRFPDAPDDPVRVIHGKRDGPEALAPGMDQCPVGRDLIVRIQLKDILFGTDPVPCRGDRELYPLLPALRERPERENRYAAVLFKERVVQIGQYHFYHGASPCYPADGRGPVFCVKTFPEITGPSVRFPAHPHNAGRRGPAPSAILSAHLFP